MFLEVPSSMIRLRYCNQRCIFENWPPENKLCHISAPPTDESLGYEHSAKNNYFQALQEHQPPSYDQILARFISLSCKNMGVVCKYIQLCGESSSFLLKIFYCQKNDQNPRIQLLAKAPFLDILTVENVMFRVYGGKKENDLGLMMEQNV